MNKRWLIGICFLTPLAVQGVAQPVEEWVRRYNGPEDSYDEAKALAVDSNGNVYVTGYSVGSGTSSDYATVKYDADGNQLWVNRYNGPGNDDDEANALAVDELGNVYVTGVSYGSDTDFDYATVKYDADGNLLWVRRYNGPVNLRDGARALAVDNAGNVYVTGGSRGSNSFSDYATIKYDADGNALWVSRYEDGENSFARALAVDDLGNVYVTGQNKDTLLRDYTTVKYDADGNPLWVSYYNGPGNSTDIPWALAVDSAGNVYVTGFSWLSSESTGYATVKYDGATGEELWVSHYNGGTALDLAVDEFGNVYVTGGSDSGYPTVKYDGATGEELWVSHYNGGTALDLAVDEFGNVYVTGGSDSDYATVKYDGTTGAELWVSYYNGPGNDDDRANALAVDELGNVYVTGQSYGSGTDSDYATIKYSQNLTVSIDIKPGNKRNVINPHSRGDMWVAVLSDTQFDPLQIDIPTVQFGSDGAEAIRYKIKDVNNDGFDDLLLRFKIPATGIACGDTEATLTGETVGGQIIVGTDSVKTVGCKPKKNDVKDRDRERDRDRDREHKPYYRFSEN